MYKFIAFGLLLVSLIENSVSAPTYQFLPPKDGYVPVYIRLGDTPLDKINPQLAAAFHENGIVGRDLKTETEVMWRKTKFMQSDQPKSTSDSEEKKKSTIQSEESVADDHSEAVVDEASIKSAKTSNESNHAKSNDDVKPFENIPKNVDVQQ